MNRKLLCCSIIIVLTVLLMSGCGGPSGTEMTLQFSFGERTGIYNGEVDDNGIPNGSGTFTTTNSEGIQWTYTGQFVNGHMEGEGSTSWEDGRTEVGIYIDDELQLEPKENVNKMYLSPDEYKYHYFEITGEVFNVIGRSDGVLQFQMNEDVENQDNNTIVVTDGEVDVSNGDYVKIRGLAQGSEEYENMAGGTVQAVVFYADTVEIVDYIEAAAPTIMEVSVNKSASLYGYTVTVNKVEFSDIETRVYVKVENGGSSNAHFFSHNAMAVQNGKQFDPEYNYIANYPDLESNLRPGNNTEAIIVFHGLEQEDFTFIINGYSDNVWENFNDYEIDIDVE